MIDFFEILSIICQNNFELQQNKKRLYMRFNLNCTLEMLATLQLCQWRTFALYSLAWWKESYQRVVDKLEPEQICMERSFTLYRSVKCIIPLLKKVI